MSSIGRTLRRWQYQPLVLAVLLVGLCQAGEAQDAQPASPSAPSGGAVVTLTSSNTSVASVPSSVTVSSGQTNANFTVRTQRVWSNTSVVISGTYAGTTQNATLTVTSGRQH